MPKPVCVTCNTTRSLLWRVTGGNHLCQDCYLIESGSELAKSAVPAESEVSETKEAKSESEPTTSNSKPVKKTGNRWTRSRSNAASVPNTPVPQRPHNPRGRGRRSIFKKTPLKAPTSSVTVVTSESIYYNV